MEQKYGNEPAVENVRLTLAPGLMVLVSNTRVAEVEVAVWVVTSLLTQVTVPPTATVTGFGWYAVFVRANAPFGMVTVTPGVGVGVGVGVGEGCVAGVSSPHAATVNARSETSNKDLSMTPANAIGLPRSSNLRPMKNRRFWPAPARDGFRKSEIVTDCVTRRLS
jgi:hypothetical protein